MSKRMAASCVAAVWLVASGAPESAGPIDDGRTWLETHQDPDGSWGDTLELVVTGAALEALTELDPCVSQVSQGAAWLASEVASNHDFLARQAIALARAPGFEDDALALAHPLLDGRNPVEPDSGLPNWPEGGWGLAPGFETDCLTTALAMLALDRNGLNGGFSVSNGAVAPGGDSIHEWELPADATRAEILITVGGSQVRLCMTEGSPPPFCNPFFPLPPGGPYLIVFPDSGLPFTPGTNFVVIESTGPAATYALTASCETPTFDTKSLAEPLSYLKEAQNGDGGWGIQRGLPTDLYTTQHVLLGLLRFNPYELDAEIAAGIAYLEQQQLGDGSFGFGGPGIPYVTALATLDLVRSEGAPFGPETEDAVAALLGQQDVDGSWDQAAYDTALAVLALWEHDLPPAANAGPDQTVLDADEDCAQGVTLAGSGSSPDGAIVGYAWTEGCAPVATGASPTISLGVGSHELVLTVTADDGQTARDSVRIRVDADDTDGDGFHDCVLGDCDNANGQVWAAPGEAVAVVFTTKDDLAWSPPGDDELGGFGVVYDVLRSGDPSDFVGSTVCVETDDGSDTAAQDTDEPSPGTTHYYLIRAENDCPMGEGDLGAGSSGMPRVGVGCE
jgi:hypothetical protein